MANNSFIRNYYPLLIVAVGFIFILIMGFFVFRFGMEKGVSSESLSYSSLCEDYPKIENEVSCEDAVKSALKKYPGETYFVNKTELTNKSVWLVGIDLENPTQSKWGEKYRVIVPIDIYTKKVGEYKEYYR